MRFWKDFGQSPSKGRAVLLFVSKLSKEIPSFAEATEGGLSANSPKGIRIRLLRTSLPSANKPLYGLPCPSEAVSVAGCFTPLVEEENEKEGKSKKVKVQRQGNLGNHAGLPLREPGSLVLSVYFESAAGY